MSFERIRRMEERDLEEVLAIENDSFLSPWSRSSFLSEIRGSNTIPLVLIELGTERVAGYLCSWIVLNECHILNLAVRRDCRRRGYASQMIDHLLRICREHEVERYYLEVRVSNLRAITLYEKFGFHICGLRRAYYQDTGEDAFIMLRSAPCQ